MRLWHKADMLNAVTNVRFWVLASRRWGERGGGGEKGERGGGGGERGGGEGRGGGGGGGERRGQQPLERRDETGAERPRLNTEGAFELCRVEHRVSGPGCGRGKVGGRDRADVRDFAPEPRRLRENHGGEAVPGDRVGADIMIGAPAGKAGPLDAANQGQDCAREIFGRGGTAGLIVDDAKFLALGAKLRRGDGGVGRGGGGGEERGEGGRGGGGGERGGGREEERGGGRRGGGGGEERISKEEERSEMMRESRRHEGEGKRRAEERYQAL